jgi:hypothetical protein
VDQPGNWRKRIGQQDFALYLAESFRGHRNILATRRCNVTNDKCQTLRVSAGLEGQRLLTAKIAKDAKKTKIAG